MADANKTELTLRVTEAAALWLKNVGAKPLETEVPVSERWVADLAAVWFPTRTEAIKQKLIRRAPEWMGSEPEKRQKYMEASALHSETYNCLPSPITVVCEVKTSKSDFYGDQKWTRESPADVRVLAMPRHMLDKDKWPQGWWVLLYGEDSGCVVSQRGPITPVDDKQRLFVTYQIAERCYHRTEYATLRDLQRSHRDQDNRRVNRARVDGIFGAILGYLESPTDFEQHFSRYLGYECRMKPPFHLKDRLEAIEKKLRGGPGNLAKDCCKTQATAVD